MLSEDGSGKGAGLVSAIAKRINARNVGQQTHVNGKGTKKNGHMNGNSHSNGLS